MTRAFRLCLAGAALVVVAGSASAAELRLGEAELDRVTAGDHAPGHPVTSIGNQPFQPFPSTTFGGFELMDGLMTPPPPPPPPPTTPPIGGGGGSSSPIQGILSILLGLTNFPR